ncbi:MAG: hypothetical protein A2167_07615 [Planctomycetes bacterium RBG_13_46_10]|nr:MAG: hypothetical protein A2167_07615 [Planctomycetes bacterium RBG_13_46_10]
MLDKKKTVFVLGAGASCPYGYPSGAHLRSRICFSADHSHEDILSKAVGEGRKPSIGDFKKTFEDSSTKSIDLFMVRNPKFEPIGKYIISFEIFKAEIKSLFREQAKRTQDLYNKKAEIRGEAYFLMKDFQGDDWYSYLFDRLTEGIVAKDDLPDFTDGRISFVTFNYDRSLEYFMYESFRNSFTEVPENKVIQCLKNLKILHLYGQVAPLKWQDSNEGVGYRPQISESLLRMVSSNIRTIYEEKQNPELVEAQNLLKRADEIFFLGFGFAPENMDVLRLPELIPELCQVYGTAFGLIEEEVKRVHASVHNERKVVQARTKIESIDVDCLMLLRKYF